MKLAVKNAVITKDKKKNRVANKMLFKIKAISNIAEAFIKDFERLKF